GVDVHKAIERHVPAIGEAVFQLQHVAKALGGGAVHHLTVPSIAAPNLNVQLPYGGGDGSIVLTVALPIGVGGSGTKRCKGAQAIRLLQRRRRRRNGGSSSYLMNLRSSTVKSQGTAPLDVKFNPITVVGSNFALGAPHPAGLS